MNLPQALELVREHIRIGKGMRLTSGVPEALEMVVKELEVTQRALEASCKLFVQYTEFCPGSYCGEDVFLKCPSCNETEVFSDCWRNYHLQQAKAGEK
jgi:hypothetical protein